MTLSPAVTASKCPLCSELSGALTGRPSNSSVGIPHGLNVTIAGTCGSWCVQQLRKPISEPTNAASMSSQPGPTTTLNERHGLTAWSRHIDPRR